MKRIRSIIKGIAIAAVWIVVWQLCSVFVADNLEFLLPSPLVTLRTLFSLASESDFWLSAATTLLHVLEGYVLGVLAGIVMGIVTYKVGFLRDLFNPIRTVIKSTPVTSFILLVLLWLDTDMVPMFITLLMVLPIVWTAIYEGLFAVDERLKEMAHVFNVPFAKRLMGIYLPSLRQQLLAALTTALGLAWKAGVTAEVIAAPVHSIGAGLYNSKIYLQTPELFAWTIVVILLSIVFEKLIVMGIRMIPLGGKRSGNKI